MKLLEIRQWGDPPTVAMSTDSSIVDRSRPVFLPDISKRWEAETSVAFRISRLGKSIGERFAHRYFDSMTLCMRFLPADLMAQLDKRGEMLSPLATSFDGSIALGRWIPAEPISGITVTSPVKAEQSGASCDSIAEVSRAIAFLSRTFILKTGDIIVLPGNRIRLDVRINDHVSAWMNENEVLTFNIK